MEEQGLKERLLAVGETLKKARKLARKSLSDVALATKIQKRHLDSLEKGELELLPGLVASKGFLKNYADYLHLDSDPLLEVYRAIDKKEKKEELPLTKPYLASKTYNLNANLIAYGIIVVLLLFLVLFYTVRSCVKRNDLNNTAHYSQEVVLSEDNLLVADFSDTSWISVENNGQEVYRGIVAKGKRLSFKVIDRLKIKIGNAAVVTLTYNNIALPKLGEDWEVVEKVFLAKEKE